MKRVALFPLILVLGWWLARASGSPQDDAVCKDGPVPVVWPVGNDGFQPRRLYTSHAQYLDIDLASLPRNRFLHTGIDIGACPGEVVYAVEDGWVFRVGGSDDPGTDTTQLFIVDSDEPHAMWIYQHLDEVWVGANAEVKRDQALGTVATFDVAPHFTHLHLQRCVLPGGIGDWLADRKDGGDPLRWLASRADPEAPEILPMPASDPTAPRLRFFDQVTTLEKTPDELPGLTVDVVASLRDLFPGPVPLNCPGLCGSGSSEFDTMPGRVTFQVVLIEEDPGYAGSPRTMGTTVYSNVIDMTQPLWKSVDPAVVLFREDSVANYDDPREFQLVLTHCLDGDDKPWTVPSGGALLLQLVLEDAAGNVDVHEQLLDLSP